MPRPRPRLRPRPVAKLCSLFAVVVLVVVAAFRISSAAIPRQPSYFHLQLHFILMISPQSPPRPIFLEST